MKNNYLPIRPNYQVVYNALQTCCKNLFEEYKITWDSGGAIGFYRCDDSNEDPNDRMKLRMFPISEETACAFLPEEEEIVRTILATINEKKPYVYLDHLHHFRKNFHNQQHFEIHFSSDNSIVTHDKHNDSINIAGNHLTWNEIISELGNDSSNSKFYQDYAKQLDHLMFKSGMDKVLVVPIPVLSTPSILFFFHYEPFENWSDKRKEEFIVALIHQAAEVVSFYLYNRLIIEFTRFVKLEEIESEKDLFGKFVRVISQILLPVSYKIDSDNPKLFFDWFGKDSEHLNRFDMEFTSYSDDRLQHLEFDHTVEFVIPDYNIPVISDPNLKTEYKFIRQTRDYNLRLERIKFTLQNIYRLIYNNWKALQRERVFVLENITPLINTLKSTDFDGLHKTLSDAKNEISNLIRSVNNLNKGSYHEEYQLKKETNGEWVFYFAGEKIHNGTEVGFETLHQILRNNGKKFEWEQCAHYSARLKDMVETVKDVLPPHDIVSKNEMLDHLKSAGDLSESIFRMIKKIESDKHSAPMRENEELYRTIYRMKQFLDAYLSISIKLKISVNENYLNLKKQSKELIKSCEEQNQVLWTYVKGKMKGTGETVNSKKTPEQQAQETVCRSLTNALDKLIAHPTLGNQIYTHFIEGNLIIQKDSAKKKSSVSSHNLRYSNPEPDQVKWVL